MRSSFSFPLISIAAPCTAGLILWPYSRTLER
jgi:hypothetical protein